MSPTLESATNLLSSPRSSKRSSAAKQLRKLGNREAGPALLAALTREFDDQRTWQPKHHMILALGHCGYLESTSYLDELARRDFESTILHQAIGDSMFRLLFVTRALDDAIEKALSYTKPNLTYGVFRAMAMLDVVPSIDCIHRILKIAASVSGTREVRGNPADVTGLRLWVAVASRNWPREEVDEFLSECEGIRDSQLALAVSDARHGKTSRKWRPY